jgi:hypothetical protein
MQFRILEATAILTIVKMFAAVVKMTEAKQVEAGFSVSPKGNRTIQQASSPKGAIDGKSGQAIPEGTLVNLWQSGRDSNDVRAYVVKAKKAKTPKTTKPADSRMDSLEAKLDALINALTK